VRAIAWAGSHVAVATVASRLTGFMRTIVLAAVLGTAAVGDGYNGANSFPNMVYELLLGGLLSSVFVPLLVQARLRGQKYAEEFTQRLLAASTLAMAVVAALTIAAAPLLASMVVGDSAQRQLTTKLAYLLLPQIFFYGMTGTLTSVLNVRDSFAPAAWAPVINNVITLATAGVFLLVPGPVRLMPPSMTTAQVLVLGLGATLVVCLVIS
jgi:putative peptidoglycan lipid II flippase